MKRYTGQKALYEAINRSRAKAKRGNILERFLPEVSRQEEPPVPAGPLPVETTETSAEPPAPVVKEPSRPVLERLREVIAAREAAKLQRLEKLEKTEVPPEKPAMPVIKSRTAEKAERPAPFRRALKWWRLKPLQLNEGRIEISVSYHIGIAVALAVILVILAGFRLGQKFPGAKAAAQAKTPDRAAAPNATIETAAAKTPPSSAPGAAAPTSESAQPQGDNCIVLATRKNAADLEPVKEHFAKSSIDLEIYALETIRQSLKKNGLNAAGLPSGDGFMLVTNDMYHNPQSPGTDGYKMRQKIAEVGATYKAPKGKDPFTPNLFKDAYGMKITKAK